ncbi:hypothetical protein SAMN05216480_12326 [Pustulibacterium marinum]|uniref:Uncharacterized protein n=1 Tax=Pustulibacterium marinum TaxID=1224947 RepID=A0A1I7IWA1_9FLAO|nr:hypothetical protein [Pustulibacterium marinum]SFU77188.1 hypothetical protein SAMN05216480_12326 [Pustulibacterium marinum]
MRPYLFNQAFTLPAGQTTATVIFTPDAGKIIGGAIFTNGEADGKLVDVELKTGGGQVVQNPVNIAAWKQRASASYVDSLMPILEQSKGGQYKLVITAETALDNDLVGSLVLAYDPSTTPGALTEQCSL